MNKTDRQSAIRELVETRVVESQEELRKLLRNRGWDVTQSTLSRDLREMRLARIPTNDGVRYAFPEGMAQEETRYDLSTVLQPFFASLDAVGELLVLKTVSGGAQAVAEAIDGSGWTEVLGTIGGENTILIVCRSAAAREKVARRIRSAARQDSE
jgi:transcriptional regulator of arginine metabolism